MNYPIGTVYTTRGKHPRVCTVTDVWTTFDAQGALVRVRYVCSHDFASQTVRETDVCATTIAMGLISVPDDAT
jgi:hypothetical protein